MATLDVVKRKWRVWDPFTVLSHVYLIPQLKQRCTRSLAAPLTSENVIDVLQLARLCDAPALYVKCMKLVSNDFKSVEKTEGWKFLQEHDPWLRKLEEKVVSNWQ